MNVQQFNTLRQHEQLRTLIINSTCIAERNIAESHVLLFQMGNGYVEVFFSPECDLVLRSRQFEDLDELEPYLQPINMSSLL